MIDKIFNNKIQNNKILLFLGFMLWCFLVHKHAVFYAYNTDEIWAWDIAKDLNFYEITQLMHYEGHSFLWYMILKPFTWFSDAIPYMFPIIIKYINLAFLGAAMFLLWMKSPINIFLKLLISYTSPFIVTYPSLGRPYGLLLLLLFIIVIQYKDRLKYPLIYSTLLFLAANTCWNGLIGVIFFGTFFVYDLYKENKSNLLCSKFIVPVFVVCSAFIILAIEWIPLFPPLYIKYFGTMNVFCEFFVPIYPFKIYALISAIIFGPFLQAVALIQYNTMRNKWFLLFEAFIFNSFFLFYLVIAPGRPHHLYFIYIYFIVIYWLLLENSEEFINNKLNFYVTTGIITLITLIYLVPFRDPHFWFISYDEYKVSTKVIKEIVPKNSRMYLILDYGSMAIAKFKDYYDLRTVYNHKIPSLRAYQSIYQDYHMLPEDIYVKEGETAYYLIPMAYLTGMDIESFYNREDCQSIYGIYVLCTLRGKNSESNE